ncbi:MAG: SDR family oxidoreductase [Sandaracinaceae bacterium]|nr:SDR family oxidoreductase [Sandaracinaceae bacterium]
MSAILVTGASRGIGRATAERLLARGRSVVLCARDGAALDAIARAHDGAYALARDLGAAPDRVVEDAADLAGGLAGIVHAAGVARHAPLEEITRDALDEMHRLHVVAPLVMAQAFARLGRPGTIVHVASTLGLRPAAGRLAYAATKAALVSMTRTLALELASRGVRVNAVAPGVVATDMARGLGDLDALAALHPLGLGTPGDVAEAIELLLDARWITGTVLVVDGGLTAG